jgi:hypothetical protein
MIFIFVVLNYYSKIEILLFSVTFFRLKTKSNYETSVNLKVLILKNLKKNVFLNVIINSVRFHQ